MEAEVISSQTDGHDMVEGFQIQDLILDGNA